MHIKINNAILYLSIILKPIINEKNVELCINYIRVIILKEKFKEFVRTKPELIKYVSSGKETWQSLFEIWSLYGSDDKVWNNYSSLDVKEEKKEVKKEETFSFQSLMDSVKKLDMDSVKKGIGNIQKVIELLQGLTTKGSTATQASTYTPRQLFKKFED